MGFEAIYVISLKSIGDHNQKKNFCFKGTIVAFIVKLLYIYCIYRSSIQM